MNLKEVAELLHAKEKKVQLIYAFNGTGKTRLSREFEELISPKDENEEDEDSKAKILYYNAFTEDLFSWNNETSTLEISPNDFTTLILKDLGQDQNVITHFQRYTDDKLTPQFEHSRWEPGDHDDLFEVVPFSAVTFSYQRGNDEAGENIKISKGEESAFIWSIFYAILDQAVEILNIPEKDDRPIDRYDELEYIFIDDPVSSLDENHLIELAVNIASCIRISDSNLKFVITTHNPLFYNVLNNELKNGQKYHLKKLEDASYDLIEQNSSAPFSYHLYLKQELERAAETGIIRKYHYNFLRNLLEKTSIFLGYENWAPLLPKTEDGAPNPYEARMINLNSHSHNMGDEITELSDEDKRVLKFLVKNFNQENRFHFKQPNITP